MKRALLFATVLAMAKPAGAASTQERNSGAGHVPAGSTRSGVAINPAKVEFVERLPTPIFLFQAELSCDP